MSKFSFKFYLKKYIVYYIIAALCGIIIVTSDLLFPQMTKRIIDDVIVAGNIQKLTIFLIGILILGINKCIFQYAKEFLCDYAGSKIGVEVRFNLFNKIQSLSADFFDGINSGELMSRVKDDVESIWNVFTFIGILTFEVCLHVCIALYFMYSLSWKLAILPTLGMFVAGFIAIKMEKKLNTGYENLSEENSKLNNTAQENLAGVRTVKAFTRENFERKKFAIHNQTYYELEIKLTNVFVKYNPKIQLISRLMPMIVVVLGGLLAINDEFSIGSLTAFIQYSMNIVWPMEMLGWLANGLSSGRASAKRINAIFEKQATIVDKIDDKTLVTKKLDGNIEFRNVTFVASNGATILDDVSFCLKSGETLGIMGETGSGKTTIINLLNRTYDVTSGKILIDGVNIKDIPLSILRKNISCVLQDVFLFSDTIEGNVQLGEKSFLLDAAIQKALKDSCSTSFVNGMEKQTQTIIGERGIGLSGGQKQRLTMARAFSRDAPILVLDDSTSALDTETEKEIQKTLYNFTGMTKIIIAHRISAVRHADKIIVMEKGRIAEEGNHESLLAKNGLYAQTYKSQY